MKDELWKPVVNFEGLYEVSNMGRVRRCYSRYYKKGDILAFKLRNKYPTVGLHKNSKRQYFAVHRLVLLAFRGPCPEGMESLHLNDIKTDNRLKNLQWMSPKENRKLAIKHGRTTKGYHCSKETKKKMSIAQTGKHLSIEHRKKISKARKGKHHSEETKKKMSISRKKYAEKKARTNY